MRSFRLVAPCVERTCCGRGISRVRYGSIPDLPTGRTANVS